MATSEEGLDWLTIPSCWQFAYDIKHLLLKYWIVRSHCFGFWLIFSILRFHAFQKSGKLLAAVVYNCLWKKSTHFPQRFSNFCSQFAIKCGSSFLPSRLSSIVRYQTNKNKGCFRIEICIFHFNFEFCLIRKLALRVIDVNITVFRSDCKVILALDYFELTPF